MKENIVQILKSNYKEEWGRHFKSLYLEGREHYEAEDLANQRLVAAHYEEYKILAEEN